LVAGLCLVTAHTIATDLASLHAQARRSGPLVPVAVARRWLPLGHVIAPGDVTTRRVFAADRPAGSFGDPDRLTGRTVAVPVLAESPVLRGALASRGGAPVGPGQRALWVPLEHAAARPRPGTVVDVLATFPGSEDPTITVARGALVLEPIGGPDPTSDGGGSDGGGSDGGVALLMTEDAAARVAYALANGAVTLALAPPESACCQPRHS
jgi:Flp pilus assembly protein CpaB